MIHKQNVYFLLEKPVGKAPLEPTGWRKAFAICADHKDDICIALVCSICTLHLAKALNHAHTKRDTPLGCLAKLMVLVLYVALGTQSPYLPAVWLQKLLFLCSSQELFKSH